MCQLPVLKDQLSRASKNTVKKFFIFSSMLSLCVGKSRRTKRGKKDAIQ